LHGERLACSALPDHSGATSSGKAVFVTPRSLLEFNTRWSTVRNGLANTLYGRSPFGTPRSTCLRLGCPDKSPVPVTGAQHINPMIN
jgi:hypothetical protein